MSDRNQRPGCFVTLAAGWVPLLVWLVLCL
jgi:hypothetical protein